MFCAVLLAVALPRDLFGSAPAEQRWTAAASEIRVLDGDALRLGDRILRLAGVVVPDRGRASCRDAAGQLTDCAAAATSTLVHLIQGRDVECRIQGQDRYGRALGTCRAGGVELNSSLIAAGWALSEGGTAALARLEAAARQGGRGLWASDATPPEVWRRRL